MEKIPFGKAKDGRAASLYTLTNKNGMQVCVSDHGATLVAVRVPDADGKRTDVVLGYDRAEDYWKNTCFFGAVIGRNGNRIGGAAFELNGKTYTLEDNENGNNLHSGNEGFDKRIWDAEYLADQNALRFTLVSPDGDEGFPGNMTASVTYTLTEDNAVRLHYQAKADADTLVNMTNHAYFNLGGHDRPGTIEDHVLWIDADAVTATDAASIPTGEIRPVAGTAFDFRVPKAVGKEIGTDDVLLKMAGGYDHNHVLNHQGEGLRKVAEVSLPEKNRRMEVFTDLPGVQFYAGNFITDGMKGKDGVVYEKRRGLCLETQVYPDAPHHENFPSSVLRAGEVYDTTTVYRFAFA